MMTAAELNAIVDGYLRGDPDTFTGGWHLIDNLDPDDARELAKTAIRRLHGLVELMDR